VVASRRKTTQIDDRTETFANMHQTQLKLNPEKCVFGVQKGKVLGCLVSVKEIKADEGLGPNLMRGRGKSIGGDLDVDDESSKQNVEPLQSLHHSSIG
jgi:hypothetical protein